MALVNPHTLDGPVIYTGAAGACPITVSVAPGTLPQAFTADTFTIPVTNVVPIVTDIELVPDPVAMVIPAGSVQAYETAPNTGSIEYDAAVKPHAPAGPDIAPCISGFLVTFIESVTETPHGPAAYTVT